MSSKYYNLSIKVDSVTFIHSHIYYSSSFVINPVFGTLHVYDHSPPTELQFNYRIMYGKEYECRFEILLATVRVRVKRHLT